MTSDCGFAFFCLTVVPSIAEVLPIDALNDEGFLWTLYKDSKTHKMNKTDGVPNIKAQIKTKTDDIITAEKDAQLEASITKGWAAFIAERPVHYCGDAECDGECGVQPCGVCIDCCRCWQRERRGRYCY